MAEYRVRFRLNWFFGHWGRIYEEWWSKRAYDTWHVSWIRSLFLHEPQSHWTFQKIRLAKVNDSDRIRSLKKIVKSISSSHYYSSHMNTDTVESVLESLWNCFCSEFLLISEFWRHFQVHKTYSKIAIKRAHQCFLNAKQQTPLTAHLKYTYFLWSSINYDVI